MASIISTRHLFRAQVTHLIRLAILLHKRPSNVEGGHCRITRAITLG